MKTITEIKPCEDSNKNVIIGSPKSCTNSKIVFGASNCTVIFHDNVKLSSASIMMEAPGGVISIGRGSIVKSFLRTGLNSQILIGSNLSSTGGGSLSAAESTTLKIGDDCMFAIAIDLRTDSSHPIFDRETGKRTNPSRSINIGNHVWVGPYACIFSGANIGDGSVVGSRSVVTKNVPEHSIVAGVPAKVIRRNIVWDKTHISTKPPYQFDNIESIINPWRGLNIEISDTYSKPRFFQKKWLVRFVRFLKNRI